MKFFSLEIEGRTLHKKTNNISNKELPIKYVTILYSKRISFKCVFYHHFEIHPSIENIDQILTPDLCSSGQMQT